MRATCTFVVVLLAACSGDDAGPATSPTSFMSAVGDVSVSPDPDTTGVTTTQVATTVSTAISTTVSTTSTTVAATQCASPAIGVTETTLVGGGAEHAMRVFVPSSFAGVPLPVVIDWHGLGSNGTDQAMYSDYEAVAEEQGFIVVHPTGVADTAGGPNSWQLFSNPGSERDDLAFAGALIDELVANWCADPARVYSTGMSNGGFFTARLVCEMADRIAAAVSVAGTYHPDTCHPSRAVPYTAIHGTADKVVPYLGGGESVLSEGDSDPSLRVFFEQVMPSEFAEFAADASCDPATTDTAVGEDVIRHEYTACEGGVPMVLEEVQDGGHTWPSSPLASLTEGALGYTTDDIDATRDGWAFMSRFTLAA